MRMILAVILLSVMLTGSIFQSYEQTVDTDGNSVISKEMDVGLILGMLGENTSEKLEAACSSDPGLDCSYENGSLTIDDMFRENDGYYSYEVDYGIPYIEHRLVVNKIPVEKFTEKLDSILTEAGVTETSSNDFGEPLNLKDSESNRENAQFLRQSGLEITYEAVMPGEVVEAYAGEAAGSVEGPRAQFMLSEVLEESQPMIVVSREINWGYILIIAAVIVLAAFALSFRKSDKKGR